MVSPVPTGTIGLERMGGGSSSMPTPTSCQQFPQTLAAIGAFEELWDASNGRFAPAPLNQEYQEFYLGIKREYASRCARPPFDPTLHFGEVEKRMVPPGSKLAFFSDIHGEAFFSFFLKKLIQDHFFSGDNTLVSLGDNLDRGIHSTHVDMLLTLAQLENPKNVARLRGNHDYAELNAMEVVNLLNVMKKAQITTRLKDGLTLEGNPTYSDPNFYTLLYKDGLKQIQNLELLNSCNRLYPLALLIGSHPLYIRAGHGIADICFDPQNLLGSPAPHAFQVMPKQLSFSSRVQRLIQENNESAHAIQRLYQQIREKTQAFEQNPENKELCQKNSCWNWGRYPDPENTSGPTTFQKQEGEEHPYQIKLSAQDLHHYFQVSKGSNGELILDVKGHDHIPTMLLEHPAASRPTGLCLPIFHGVPYIIVPIFQTGHRYEDWKVSFWILPRPMGATKLHEVKIYETEAVPLTKLSIVFSNVFQNTSSLIQQHPDPAQKIRLLVRSTSPFSCVPSRFHPAPALPHPSTTTKSPNG